MRCRVSAVWITLAVATALVYMFIFPKWAWFGRNSDEICPFGSNSLGDLWRHFVTELLFDARLLLLALAPLADDQCLTRCALLLDAAFIGYMRITILRCASSKSFAHLLFNQKAEYLSYLARGVLILCCAAWAILQPTATRMQSRMWDTLAVAMVTNICEKAFRGGYDLVAKHEFSAELGQVPPNMLALWIIFSPELRRRVQAKIQLWTKLKGAMSTAACIACFLGDIGPKEAVDQAKERFHAVCLSDLSPADVADNRPNPSLYVFARPVRLGSCDAFVSHSWHDPAQAKWDAMQSWCSTFAALHGNEPLLWFDKCCIDQSNIELDLRCLPIFLSGCKRLVILCGPTYLSRLWCVVEIFTYMQIHGSFDQVTVINVLRDGHQEKDLNDIKWSFETFDARNCRCFQASDKERLLAIVATACGSIEQFSSAVSKLMAPLTPNDVLSTDEASEEDGSVSTSEDSD